jgi:hypothetical protein
VKSIRRVPVSGKRRLALLCLLVATPLGVATAKQLAPPSTSPATGHAQVVTQGIASLPSEPMVWRVVQRTAQPRWAAKAGRRVLGFVLASDEPVLLTNVTDGNGQQDVARLGTGEAYLVQGGTRQIRASMSDQPVDYLSLEIVPAGDSDKIGNGTLLYTSPPFTPPPGSRDIDLVRNVLQVRETATLPDSGDSVYILATDGAIDILPASGGPKTTLQPGESGIFTGALEITAVLRSTGGANQIAAADLTASLLQEADTSAGYVVAVIGEEIPPVQTPTPEPTVTPFPTATVPVVEVPTDAPEPAPTLEPTSEPTVDPKPTTETQPDGDGDGLPDTIEQRYGTDPANPDSDRDGLSDGDEVKVYGTEPLKSDTDADGLDDGAEVNKYGTQPTNPDTDGDGTTDGREVASGHDPLDPNA